MSPDPAENDDDNGMINPAAGIPDGLSWLVDNPLFIDDYRVSQLYDIVDQPLAAYEASLIIDTVEQNREEEEATGTTTRAGAEAGISVLKALKSKVNFEAEFTNEMIERLGNLNTYKAQQSSLRQLALLTSQYDEILPNRTSINVQPFDQEWYDYDEQAEELRETPPELVFLDLPGRAEVQAERADGNDRIVETKIIPMAAEFEDGAVVPVYNELQFEQKSPPRYPETGEVEQRIASEGDDDTDPEDVEYSAVREYRQKEYWEWFEEYFQPKPAIEVLEQEAADHGRIDWISYRMPLSNDGHTLHLTAEPSGEYPTGNFAYNLIKRGYKHGVRVVGTMKSEPDLNVLAIFEK